MTPPLDARVVVVTGAAQGQGAAEVELLRVAGATVVAADVQDAAGADDMPGVLRRRLDVREPAGVARNSAAQIARRDRSPELAI